ncbi:TetR/AcrR family transcriptional regulator [Streptacidiphilus sp. N1-3]|uniref:TetR/AcrR family transcriptional regulator n=1 Tax=Streptacidiphilus alkalitolerans TaxID=3342712 RepID=A0ABV6X112_9ACTN
MAVQHAHPDSDTAADPRPRRRDAARNHQLVVDAAREVLSEFGTDASMELIASRAGVGVGTVYRRFPNKEALIDELVRLILVELVTTAGQELAKDDGSGLETYLRVLGRSLSDHRGYADKLVGRTKAACAAHLRVLTAELLAQAQQHGRVRADITLGDVLATVYALRGIITTTGDVAPGAWERHLDIQLAGFRAPDAPSRRPSLTPAQLARISGGG